LRLTADSDSVGQAFSIDAAEKLDGDVDVSIGGTWYDWRRKIVALNHSHGVAAPAKPDTDSGLGCESHLVGVNSYKQKYIRRPSPRAANSKGGGICSGSRRGIAHAARRIGRSDVRTDGAVIREHRGATRLARIGGCCSLRLRQTRARENAPTPVHERNVRF
jgi:hypothetical protein